MLSNKVNLNKAKREGKNTTTYGSRYFSEPIPKFEIPESGMPPRTAYRLINDELNLDGNPNLNLASFVTTWMEPEADVLIAENNGKNFIDNDEYPQTEIIQNRVVNMLARLFNAPGDCDFVGTSTIGSSEAIMLGILAHKWAWRENRKKKGINTPETPNIIMGADVHVVWEKFAKYFDVELRMVPMEKNNYILTADKVKDNIDENTIAIGVILGTTFTGQIDEIEKINDLLEEVKETKGWDIPIHVDGASGGFVVPFIYPNFKWDFRLSHVRSINVSGHKYGLVYPGVGWLIFKDKKFISEDLIFHVNYLGGVMPTFNLNFSKGSSMILAQYYNLLRLGKGGYTQIMENLIEITNYLRNNLEETDVFELLGSDLKLPIIAIKIKEEFKDNFTVFDISRKLREKGWLVPAYTLPANDEETAVLRIVVKENFSRDMADLLMEDIYDVFSYYNKLKDEGNDDIKEDSINIF
ncbi:glutamate decarboxylase [Methanobrevibacter cuticularis]|uniref:glutamate decarboxylase n=1 Tax=Methanobrevibacter cuticularis TaxID=47311 RepID=A0A166EY29_9EURY|nr:glutamate decarboxylase [Methanobrevibacter cuticularis]KZX17131.1 glutamate decarboxylase [Methanobrevibacter cuticularis]